MRESNVRRWIVGVAAVVVLIAVIILLVSSL